MKAATVGDYLPVAGGAIHNRNFWLADQRLIDDGFETAYWRVDEDYGAMFNMTIVQGENFSGIASAETESSLMRQWLSCWFSGSRRICQCPGGGYV